LVAAAVEMFGGLDVMVNNAGITRDATMRKMTEEQFDDVISVHLKGCWNGTRQAAAIMREAGGGSIINMSSISAKVGFVGQTNYSAAKAGIVGFVRTWAMELARANVTVNAVVPVAATAMTETIPAFAPYVEALKNGEPFPDFLRKGEGFGTPEDCAALVPFLASEAARGITGQAIGIGGDKVALWSHPQEIRTAYADGGWTPGTLADAVPTSVGAELQTVGIPAPKFPEA
jgi:NAD(P)-dependent dehydrogenase (short-subunit alcohol dehydrogenase family)